MHLMTLTAEGYYAANNATLTGDVTVGDRSSFWFATVVRGDVAPVRIGNRVNVQDGAVIHCDTDVPNFIGDDVSIGHRAIVHGEYVGRGTLIGMGATVLSRTNIGEECLIAAGAVVPPGMRVPDRTVVMGVPGKIVRGVTDEELKYMRWVVERYIDLAERYVRGEFGEVRRES